MTKAAADCAGQSEQDHVHDIAAKQREQHSPGESVKTGPDHAVQRPTRQRCRWRTEASPLATMMNKTIRANTSSRPARHFANHRRQREPRQGVEERQRTDPHALRPAAWRRKSSRRSRTGRLSPRIRVLAAFGLAVPSSRRHDQQQKQQRRTQQQRQRPPRRCGVHGILSTAKRRRRNR